MAYESHPEGGNAQAADAADAPGAPDGDDDGGLWTDKKIMGQAGHLDPPSKAEAAMHGDGLAPPAAEQGVSSFTFVFLALAFLAILVGWKSQSRHRRNGRTS